MLYKRRVACCQGSFLPKSWAFSMFEGLFESLHSCLSAACFVWPIDLDSVACVSGRCEVAFHPHATSLSLQMADTCRGGVDPQRS